jgi:hypothetical protein
VCHYKISKTQNRSCVFNRLQTERLKKAQTWASLQHLLRSAATLAVAYRDVIPLAHRDNVREDVIDRFPDTCPFTVQQLLPEL